MLLQKLREEVLQANLELVARGLVIYTFGNASGFDPGNQLVVIKPSGVEYNRLTPANLVITDLDGRIVEGELRPSSDLPTHLALYKSLDGVRGIAHTHSLYATAWAQAAREIPCFGTTHADYFHGPVPVTRSMRSEEIESDYEWNTGQVIVERFKALDPHSMTAVLVANHAPFCWGANAAAAAHTASMLEEVAHMAILTLTIEAEANVISRSLHDKHYLRKHGASAYYGQQTWKQ